MKVFFFPYTIRLYGFLSDISLNEWDLNPVKFQIKLQNFLDCLSPFFQMENTCNEIYEYWPLGTSHYCNRTLNERFWTPGVKVTRSCVCYAYAYFGKLAQIFASVALVESWEKPRYQNPERDKHMLVFNPYKFTVYIVTCPLRRRPENGYFSALPEMSLFIANG